MAAGGRDGARGDLSFSAAGGRTLNSDLLHYVSSLRPAFRVALLSNSFAGARERDERAYGFSSHVDEVIYSHEEGLKKPDADFYLLACQRLEVEPPEVLFVDDREPCVAAARDLGMTAIRFTTEEQTMAAIESVLAPARTGASFERPI